VNGEVWGSSLAAGEQLQTAERQSIFLIDWGDKKIIGRFVGLVGGKDGRSVWKFILYGASEFDTKTEMMLTDGLTLQL